MRRLRAPLASRRAAAPFRHPRRRRGGRLRALQAPGRGGRVAAARGVRGRGRSRPGSRSSPPPRSPGARRALLEAERAGRSIRSGGAPAGSRPPRRQPRRRSRIPPIPAPAVTTGTTIPEALSAFNGSNHRRTVAGLTRTLGPPRATAIAIENGGRPARGPADDRLGADLVPVGGRAQRTRLTTCANPARARRSSSSDPPTGAWNLLVDADGTLEQKTAATPADGE